MFSKRVISLLVVLSMVSQAMVLINTETSNFVDDSSPLEQVPEYGGARGSPSNRSIPFTHLQAPNHIPTNVITNGEIMIFMSESSNSTYGGQGKGLELYVSDGTLNGTSMIKDLNPDGGDINANLFNTYTSHVWWNDVLYLNLDDGTDETGAELWRTDATAAGTYIVKDIREGSYSSGITGLTLWEDHIYFSAYDGTHGYELWQSDGTENGTFMLKEIYPGNWPNNGMPPNSRDFTIFNDKLYFQGIDEEHGPELWTTDGTENGTTLVVDIYPGTMGNGKGYPSSPDSITVFEDYMYFAATNASGKELWKSDGTENGTSQVKDIWPGSTGSISGGGGAIVTSNLDASRVSLDQFAIMGDNFYFTAKDTCSTSRCVNLWKSDGTENGTVPLTDFEDEDGTEIMLNRVGVVVGESKMVFVVDTEEYDEELWITDGTPEGTHLVTDLNPDGDSNIYSVVAGSGDIFYFGAMDGDWCSHCEEHPQVLWKTDGTEEGTIKVNSTSPKPPPYDTYVEGIGENGYEMLRFGNHLIFDGYNQCGGGGGNNYPGCQMAFWILHNISSGFSSQSYTLYKDVAMNPITFDYDGENVTWAIYPTIPSNLSFNSTTGTITGTPDELFGLTDYTVYANGSVNKTYKIRLQSLPYPDTDGDGVCDGASAVSGICTAGPDAFPFDAAASVDTDGDGMPDTLTGESTSEPPLVEDLDDDNDGLLDLDEIANGTEPLNPDTDGDGYCDGSGTAESCIAGDVFPLNENEWFDTDGDGTGNNADTDDDNDGLDDTTEASSDPVTNSTNPDTDGDGVCDGSVDVTINDVQICIGGPDELPTDPDETIDTDGDGIGNNEDTDDDGDGLSDDEENDIGTNTTNPDTDGDFYCDGPIVVTGCAGSDDAFPLDDSEWLDTDGDDIGNNADTDDDGDSYADIWEIDNGYDPLDGCDPNLNSSTCDQDYDGLNNGEEEIIGTNTTNPDTDGDGFCDGDLGVEGTCVAGPDDFPLDPAAHLDTDGDGMPDTINGTSTSDPALIEDLDDDNDGLLDLDEIANGTEPLNPDSDGDGYCDGLVTIVDVCEAVDVFPLDENEWFDTDGDEIGNNADLDDDGDGYNDTVEETEGSDSLNFTSTPVDTDGDFDPDSTDPDDDNDGYNDTVDAFPTDETEWTDTDGDEIGNNADPDDDGDGYNDMVEVAEGSDPLNFTSIPLDTDGDFDPDSTDPDDDDDGFDDGVDVFPTNSAEWLDTDDDGTGNNADTDDDGDGLTDEDEAALGSDPLIVDTDADGIPDNWDPMPTDPDGDFDKDGILDRDEYKPNADGEPADTDGDGVNDMLQDVASGSSTSSSDRSWRETCCWILLLLLLLLIPLLKKRYDNSLVYDPNSVEYVIGDKDQSKLRMVPSLHEYTKKYISTVNSEGLRRITYAISGNLVEGLNIDSKTGIISGHPEKVGEYKYDVVMKHSNGKFKGEVTINVLEDGKESEKEQEPVSSSNPEPENTTAKPKFEGGTGTMMDSFVIKPAKGLEPGEEIVSKQVITISGLEPGGVVNMQDLNSKENGKRFAIVAEPDEVGRQSALVADDDGRIKFRVNFKDDEPSTDGAEYESLIKLGMASVYLSWAVDVAKEESEEEPELEAVVKEEPEAEVPLSKEEKKEKEIERVKARSEKIDFEVLGEATSSTLSKPVEKDASEIDLEDASDFEKAGTATITDVDGSEIITWTSKKGNALFGIAGLTRAFVAASIVVAKDDLQVIKGIGPFIEEKLNALGIYMFVQIARMTSELEEDVNIAIEFFPGRVKRDEWARQAKELSK